MDKLKTDLVNLKRLSDVKSIIVVKITKFNKLDTKVNNLENEIPDVYTLIQANQYNADKQVIEKI